MPKTSRQLRPVATRQEPDTDERAAHGARPVDGVSQLDLQLTSDEVEKQEPPLQLLPAAEYEAELARRHHLDFMQWCWQRPEPMVVGAHTRAICERIDRALDDFAGGKSTFLVVAVPFRHGKSDLVSRYLPPRFLGRFPDEEVMLATYAATLSHGFSRFGRSLMADPHYQRCYPHAQLSRSSSSVQHWELGQPKQGGLTAVGLGGSMTGRGYALGILDDFFRNRAEAESPHIRAGRWDSFTNDFQTRRAPVSITLVVATPWHVDDIIGRIKGEMSADRAFPRYEFLRFPAFSDDYPQGVLFPERFTREWYVSQRATLGSYGTASLLQCDPVPRGGRIFKTDAIAIVEPDAVPAGLTWGRGWDLASTEKQRTGDDPDWTVGLLGAVQELPAPAGVAGAEPVLHIWIRDVQRFREEAPARDRRIKQTALIDGPAVRVWGESVAGYKDTWTNLRAALRGLRKVGRITPRHDLMVRTAAVEPIVEAGRMHIVRGLWNADFIDELRTFRGAHDDQVAALVTLFEGLYKSGRWRVA